MGRVLLLVLVVVLVVGLGMICGFTLLEGIIIFHAGIFGTGFLAWIVQGFRPNLIRCVLFWWIANLLGKPQLLYPKLSRFRE